MAEIPSDPIILLSFINMKLRDEFPSLDELCESLDIDENDLKARLSAAGFEYIPSVNQFR